MTHVKRLLALILLLIPSSVSGQNFSTGLVFADPNIYQSIPLSTIPLLGNIPQEVDLSPKFPRPGNQGRQGSCVGWSIAYMKSYQEAIERRWDVNSIDSQFSPAYIYNQVKINNDCNSGSLLHNALNLLTSSGIAKLNDFPYNQNDCSAMPSPIVRQRAQEFSIANWRRVNVQDETEVKSQIASGFPVLIGMIVDDSFQRIRGPQIYSQPNNVNSGGHAMVVVGYSQSRGAFKVINSWGTDWGDNGFGWISYSTFRSLVREGYTAQDIVVNTPTPTPQPNPQPAPQPSPQPIPLPPQFTPSALIGQPNIIHGIIVNSTLGPRPGMRIQVPGTISGVQNRNVQIVVKFSFVNGPPLRANPQEIHYRDSNGIVSTGTPSFQSTAGSISTEGIDISIPYYALNFLFTNGASSYSLNSTAFVFVDNALIATSISSQFSFRW